MLDELRSRAGPGRMHPRTLVQPDSARPLSIPNDTDAVVVGGGIAGVSAGVVLAERGVSVTLIEAAETLGGRLAAWPETLPDGTAQNVEHGFHAFFRHYYTWRDVLRRVDPQLGFLQPVDGYPVSSRAWPDEDITGLPGAPPLNLLALLGRSPSLTLRDIATADRMLAAQLLAYDPERTPAVLGDLTAAEFLDRLGMSDRARAMLFEAFARSFFNTQDQLCAAELVAMFHYYFLGNPEGIRFDVPGTDHRTAIWDPLAEHLRRHGVSIRLGARAAALSPGDDRRWRVDLDGTQLDAAHLVLALDPGGLRTLLANSPDAATAAPRLARQVDLLHVAPPYAVTRLWLDRDVAPDRAPFTAVTREPTLDSVSCYHRFEQPSRDWARRTGGAVLELHSYSCAAPTAREATDRMRAELAALWPETVHARVLHCTQRLEAAAPAFPPGAARPGVLTDAPGVRLAGDLVETPYLSGLMERSAMSGVLAANDILSEEGAAVESVRGVPQRGLLAGLLPARG